MSHKTPRSFDWKYTQTLLNSPGLGGGWKAFCEKTGIPAEKVGYVDASVVMQGDVEQIRWWPIASNTYPEPFYYEDRFHIYSKEGELIVNKRISELQDEDFVRYASGFFWVKPS